MKNYEDKNKRTNPIVNLTGEEIASTITSTGNSIANIFDVWLNGNSPANSTNGNMNTSLNPVQSKSWIGWLIGGVVIVGILIGVSLYLKKK